MKTYTVTTDYDTRYISAPTAAAAKMEVARARMDFLPRRERGLAFAGLRVRVCKDQPPTAEDVARANAASWNDRYPVGTMVRYWRGVREGEPSGTGKTRSLASVGSRVCAVVWIEGCSGCVALSHVEVVNG